MYSCIVCKFITDSITNIKRHCKTSKHVNLCDINVICRCCIKKYSHRTNLLRHIKTCEFNATNFKLETLHAKHFETETTTDDENHNIITKMKFDYEKKLSELEKEKAVLEMKEKLAIAETEARLLREMNTNNNITGDVLKESLNVAKKSISTSNYIIKYMTCAPELKKLKYETITNHIGKYKKGNKCLLNYEPEKRDLYMKRLFILKYENKTLDEYIVTAIVAIYKTDNPHDQSFWISDVTRFTALVRQLIGNELKWYIDKNSEVVLEFIVRPLLTYIKDKVNEYRKDGIKKFDKLGLDIVDLDNDFDDGFITAKEVPIAMSLVNDINNGVLEHNIMKQIALKFHFNKDTYGGEKSKEIDRSDKAKKIIRKNKN